MSCCRRLYVRYSYVGYLVIHLPYKAKYFTVLGDYAFESIVRQEENAGAQNVLYCSQCFLYGQNKVPSFLDTLHVSRLQNPNSLPDEKKFSRVQIESISSLTLSQTSNFRLSQTERVSRRHLQS